MPVLTLNGKPLISNNQVLTGSGGGDSYTNGDNLAYGSAGLAGTTWFFNATLDFTGVPSILQDYSLDFVSNNTSFSVFAMVFQGSLGVMAYGEEQVYFSVVGWYNSAYRTITITGGDDANNPDLIAWIQANAVQQ